MHTHKSDRAQLALLMRIETRGDAESPETLGLPRADRRPLVPHAPLSLVRDSGHAVSTPTREPVNTTTTGCPSPAPLSPSEAKSPARSSVCAAQKTVYTLLDSMALKQVLRPSFADLTSALGAKARPLLDAEHLVSDGKERIEQITDGYASRFMLRLLKMDKAGHKLEEIDEKVAQLQYYDLEHKQLVPLVRNDWGHQDTVARQISERCEAARDLANDDFYKDCSGERKRGRKKKKQANGQVVELPEEYNAVEVINRPYITPRRSGDDKKPALDLSRAFQCCLDVANAQLAKTCNHGWHLETLLHLMRKLTNEDHPMHELLLTLNNMEYCASYRRQQLQFDPDQERFYCCVSGQSFSPGEEAHCLTFVLRDAERDKEWSDYKLIEGREFEKPQFRRSVRTALFKLALDGPVSLFGHKRGPARQLDVRERKRVRRSDESLQWELMGVLLATLEKQPELYYREWQWATEKKQIGAVINAIQSEAAAVPTFDKVMQYFIQSAGDASAQQMPAEKDALFESVLDWLDTLAPRGQQPHALIRQLQLYAEKRAKHASELLDARHPYLPLFVFLYQCVRDERRQRQWKPVEQIELLVQMGLYV